MQRRQAAKKGTLFIRAILILLFCGFRASAVVENQTLLLHSGYNFAAINLEVGKNEIEELFPDAPRGMLVFTYDNATGFKASQKGASAWSEPSLRIAALR